MRRNFPNKIFVVIINWNRKDLTIECLQSLESASTQKNITIVLVDNNSDDDSIRAFKRLSIPFHLIQNKQNSGWACGHNVGIKYALQNGASCVFVLANDATINKKTIYLLAEKLYSNEKVGIVGPKTYYPRKRSKSQLIADAGGVILKHRYFGTNRGQGKIDKGQYDTFISPDYITGAAMLIKRELFEKIGLFNERLFIYYEDVDLCFRAKKAGFDLLFVPEATVYHHFAATTKIGSPLHNYYTTRNHYLFVEEHAPFSVRLRELIRTPKTVWELLITDDQIRKKYSLLGIRDYFLRRFGKRTYW